LQTRLPCTQEREKQNNWKEGHGCAFAREKALKVYSSRRGKNCLLRRIYFYPLVKGGNEGVVGKRKGTCGVKNFSERDDLSFLREAT